MALLGWLWLGSPFAVIAVIRRDLRLQSLVAAHLGWCHTAGCTGALMMVLGVLLIPSALGTALFAVGTPLVGLAVWQRGNRDDDGHEDEPDPPPFDWDEFERAFWAHVRRSTGPHRGA